MSLEFALMSSCYPSPPLSLIAAEAPGSLVSSSRPAAFGSRPSHSLLVLAKSERRATVTFLAHGRKRHRWRHFLSVGLRSPPLIIAASSSLASSRLSKFFWS